MNYDYIIRQQGYRRKDLNKEHQEIQERFKEYTAEWMRVQAMEYQIGLAENEDDTQC